MPAIPDKQSTHIELVPASPEQESVIANLLELYAHDFSEFYPLELGEDGRFGYQHLSLYWSEPDRCPFLIKINGNLAGLVLIKKNNGIAQSGLVWDVAEFFIVRAHRRQRIGTKVAHQLWERFPGSWEVRVMESNRDALKFWQRAITGFIGAAINPAHLEKDGRHWHVFQFESAQDAKK